MFRIEPRKEPSRLMLYATPLIAVVLTILSGFVLFSLLGKDPVKATVLIFVTPLTSLYSLSELIVKATPLVLTGAGLALCFRANVWNIGAEGQYIAGAIAGTGVALLADGALPGSPLPLMCVAGVLGGMAWAALPALLRTRFRVNEILVTLMLTYVAVQLLFYLTRGPWRDPNGFNFPQTRLFEAAESMPIVVPGTVIHLGVPLAVLIALIMWVVMQRTSAGFAGRTVGLAPQAAVYGGFRSGRVVWFSLMLSGGLAGLAGIFEAAGPFGQLTPQFGVGYGFAAIIVAFLGRLNPIGIILGALVLAVSIVGGEIAQTRLGVPNAAIGVFQAMMLFFLLAVDVFVRNRLVIEKDATA